jgi:hypothetical protein
MWTWFAFIVLAACSSVAESRGPGPEPVSTEVRVRAFLVDVDDISSVQQNFTANLFLEFRWPDPERLGGGSSGGTKNPSKSTHPRFKLVNSQRVWDAFDGEVEQLRKGELVLHQRLWGQFSQPLDLVDFPFDEHTFEIQIASVIHVEGLRLIPDPGQPSGMAERLSVADWEISDFRVETRNYEPIPGGEQLPGLLISFDGRRRVSHYVVKVIVPLILIVAMSWVVFWIDPKESGSQIGVAVTTMLTLIAYRFAVGSEVPNIHYLTRMDRFLLGSTVLVFASLVEVVVTSSLASRDRVERARSVDRWARWLFPLGFVGLTLNAFVL